MEETKAPPACLTAALNYLNRGWSVLPLCPPDHVGVKKGHRGCGSPGKRPFFPDTGGGEWKRYQTERASEQMVRDWWSMHPRLNLGMALGPVSGLVGIDVDDEEGETLLTEISGGDIPETWEYTTGKGRRLLYRLPAGATVINNAFRRPGTEIEILRFMSSGGQVVLPPSIHPNGAAYRWVEGRSPDDIPAADVPAWMRGEAPKKGAETTRPADGELITEGGRNSYLASLAGAMRRRGAEEPVILAALRCTNETRFDPPLAETEIESVARSIARYAPDELPKSPTVKMPDRSPGDYNRRFKWSSELSAPPRVDEWIWQGYLPRQGITLLSALWKAGKTTLLAHLLKALANTGSFLGQPITASRVLYVSEEGERHWVRRRDDLNIGDNTGFYLQPFAVRPTAMDWVGFLADLRSDIEAHKFDLVVFDTLAKLWPVTEENDAGQVDAALMPLWELTKAGAGVLLIHHLRKSGGSEYTGSRGSGALSAFPDIIVELTRFDATDAKCKKRVLKAKGRYEETPDELVMELIDGEYVHVPEARNGDPLAVLPTDNLSEESKLLYILKVSPQPWLQIEDIRSLLQTMNWGIRNKDITTHLFSLYSRKEVAMAGMVRSKTFPRQYCLASRAEEAAPSRSAPGCDEGTRSGNEMESDE